MKLWAILLNLVGVAIFAQKEADMSCCNLTLMDSAQKVVIEGTPIANGTYEAIQVRFCYRMNTTLMVWEKLPGDNTEEPVYKLVWSYSYMPGEAEVNTMQYTVIVLPDTLVVGQNQYFGMHVPNGDKITVPYQFNDLYKLRVAMAGKTKYDVGDEVMVEMITWPRSFKSYYELCPHTDCPPKAIPSVPGGPPGVAGPPGPPGPPGPCESLNPDLIPPSCDIGQDFGDKISDIDDNTKQMMKVIQDLQFKLDEISKGNQVAGLCPPGYELGPSGTGSCYKFFFITQVTFAEAFLGCRSLENENSMLVSITSELEYQFLKDEIRSKNPERYQVYWTSGMYSNSERSWIWYGDEDHERMAWTKWAPDSPTNTLDNGCQTLNLDLETGEAIWYAVPCDAIRAYYICKAPKTCP